MPADTPATLKPREFSTSPLGLAAIFFGYLGLVAAAAGGFFSPGPLRGLSFITTSVPLIVLFSGTLALSPPDQTDTGNVLIWQLRVLGLGALFLFPFVSWMLVASRNTYLTACAFLALLCLSIFLQRLCEYLRLLYTARHARMKSLRAHQAKQLAHFCLVTPCGVAAVIILVRQKMYDMKAPELIEIIWRNSSWPVKIILTTLFSLSFCAVMGLLLDSLFSLTPRSMNSSDQIDGSNCSGDGTM